MAYLPMLRRTAPHWRRWLHALHSLQSARRSWISEQ